MNDRCGKKSTKKWNKKEPIPCWDCGMPSCSQAGSDRHWYCFRCLMNNYGDDEEIEVDNTMQVCHEQLEKQSMEYV